MKCNLLIILLLICHVKSFAAIRYVKEGGTGSGTSWADASGDLKATLDAAVTGDTIWVAKGTYKPDETGSDRTKTFNVKSGVKLLGGFWGDETPDFNLLHRDFIANETILSGDIGTAGSVADNSFNVISTIGVSDQTLIEGFTVTKGNGIGNPSLVTYGNGGGWFNEGLNGSSKPIISKIKFVDNQGVSGAAIFNNGYSGEALPIIINCQFIGNYATNNGGAIYNRGTSGGANLKMYNCTFYQNTADNLGGSVYNFNSVGSVIYNCIFWESTQSAGSSSPVLNDIYSEGTSSINTLAYAILSSLTTGILGGSVGFSSSLVSGSPHFKNSVTGDLSLTAASSIAINHGVNAGLFGINDASGRLRIRNGTVDIGAFEFQGLTTRIYVDSSVVFTQGDTWATAFKDLQNALHFALPGDSIWVAKGTYKPTAGTDRSVSFEIPDSVKVFGGFVGNEPNNYDLNLRDFSANETILSGDIGILSDSLDNSFSVVYTKNVSNYAEVNGFTIEKGNSDLIAGSSRHKFGGGWYNFAEPGKESSPRIINCTFTKNYGRSGGGGFFSEAYGGGTSSSVRIENCSFYENKSSFGGAIFLYCELGEDNSLVLNSWFSKNQAEFAGAIYLMGDNGDLSTEVINCLFDSNGEDHIGYDDGNVNTQPLFVNCTFFGATSKTILIRFFDSGQTPVDFTNCIFWGNNGDISNNDVAVNVQYSIVEEAAYTSGSNATKNNLNADPKFVDATNKIFNLRCDSPALDHGTPANAPFVDISGFTRTGNPDAGAYEYGHAEVSSDIANGRDPELSGVPYITASSFIENTNDAWYRGINYVELLPGFEVAPAPSAETVFRAEIGGGCL